MVSIYLALHHYAITTLENKILVIDKDIYKLS